MPGDTQHPGGKRSQLDGAAGAAARLRRRARPARPAWQAAAQAAQARRRQSGRAGAHSSDPVVGKFWRDFTLWVASAGALDVLCGLAGLDLLSFIGGLCALPFIIIAWILGAGGRQLGAAEEAAAGKGGT